MAQGVYHTVNGVYTTVAESRLTLVVHGWCVCVYRCPGGVTTCMSELLSNYSDRAESVSSPSDLLVQSRHILHGSL